MATSWPLALGVSGLLSYISNKRRNSASLQCCGIFAYLGPSDAWKLLIDGLRLLQNRGFDSCGISTIDDSSHIVTSKFASRESTGDCIDLLESNSASRHSGHKIGIAHTRWATHGAKTEINAHPHSDYKQRISLVHNGTIENYAVLKNNLVQKGISFLSQTDSEVIANLIGSFLDEGKNFGDAVTAALGVLDGTWGIAVIHRDFTDKMILASNGSSIVVGGSENEIFVASETTALMKKVKQFISLRDGEVFEVSRDSGMGCFAESHLFHEVKHQEILLTPEPYPHWTLKEINEQPESLDRALNFGGRICPHTNTVFLGGLDSRAEDMAEISYLVLAGCGTSLYAAMYGERILQCFKCFKVIKSYDASEFTENCVPEVNGAALFISQSGETLDTIKACKVAESAGLARFSVVNIVASKLARMTGCGVYLNAGREVSVASTKAFTSQVVVLTLIAIWFAIKKRVEQTKISPFIKSATRMPACAKITLETHKACRNVARNLVNATSIFVLGKGFAFPVALEASLKLKEISYIHAEGFPAGALKHGPFAMIDAKTKTPAILIMPNDENFASMTTTGDQLADDIISVPSNGPLTSLLCVIPVQLIAYELAILRKINPDQPRGLAKTVTVA